MSSAYHRQTMLLILSLTDGSYLIKRVTLPGERRLVDDAASLQQDDVTVEREGTVAG